MWHDNETEQDLIGFQRFAATVATLATNPDILPVTIGIFGDWGSGKSSVLRMVGTALQDQPQVLTLRFDGWLFEGYDDAKAALMTTIIDEIGAAIRENETLWQKAAPRIEALLRSVNWFRALGLAAKGLLTLTAAPDPGIISAISSAEAVAESTLRPAQTQNEAPPESQLHRGIRKFRSDFEALVQEAEINSLVVLIDDLDRCLPDSITSTLEAIKLFLSVPHTAFVIAADERIVRDAIARRYPTDSWQQYDLAQEYLDKLVQVPCILPPMDETETETYIHLLFAQRCLEPALFDQLREAVRENQSNAELVQPINFGIAKDCLKDSADVLEHDFDLAARIAPILSRHLRGNPRLVKRFLNTFALRSVLADAEGIALNDGILSKLMVLERFHQDKFESLYRWQVDQQGIPEQLRRLERGDFDEADAELLTWIADPDLVAWTKMDPTLTGVNLGSYFHLARESLRLKSPGIRRLSPDQQEVYAGLQSASQAARTTAANKLIEQPPDIVSTVYDALWTKVKVSPRGSLALEGLLDLARVDEASARRLVEDLASLPPSAIEGKVAPRLARVGQAHGSLSDAVDAQLSEWSTSTNKGLAGAAKAVAQAKTKKSKSNGHVLS